LELELQVNNLDYQTHSQCVSST